MRAKSFGLERNAKQHLAEQQVAVSRGVYLDESRGKVTFAEWAEQYFSAGDPHPDEVQPVQDAELEAISRAVGVRPLSPDSS